MCPVSGHFSRSLGSFEGAFLGFAGSSSRILVDFLGSYVLYMLMLGVEVNVCYGAWPSLCFFFCVLLLFLGEDVFSEVP